MTQRGMIRLSCFRTNARSACRCPPPTRLSISAVLDLC